MANPLKTYRLFRRVILVMRLVLLAISRPLRCGDGTILNIRTKLGIFNSLQSVVNVMCMVKTLFYLKNM